MQLQTMQFVPINIQRQSFELMRLGRIIECLVNDPNGRVWMEQGLRICDAYSGNSRSIR